ncbi:metallophosphoesterase [Phytomonospora endophytica]|uniref:3',5'-cyclic AMP phosphodiesterase CpdA n=1 Tax=Phytomonospora endophytica TaxID=714109 RepID=A0A841FRV2_9ACTN|nr:metallophosphoesterase [Phytomonospora endophytica]MBB6035279.1 3',5'-cyclic AMP phosphodiesterase CpdA [Phytomonospora endophytica]GIG63972.1 3',5'-cyclic adenosine monophosphate phosphodiesterase CpdA [Phytomonospora endophytica]
MLLAHISDTHIDGGERATERTRRVMDYLNGLTRPLDAIVVTGDIADHGEAAEYEIVARLLDSPHPVVHLPGNHDRRDAYRKVLGGPDEFLNTVHHVAGHALVLLDSLIEGADEGELAPATLDWLGARLAELRDTPTLVAFHHPPVRMHQERVDTWMLQNPSELAAILDANPQVIAVLTGHTHTAAASTFAGRPLLIAPGVTSTLRLDWEPGESLVDADAPPGVAFHVVEPDGRIMTHWRVV